MTIDVESRLKVTAEFATRWRRSRWRLRARRFRRVLEANFSSSLTRRIVFLNLGGLLALVVGVLWLNHFRADIIEAKTQSLTMEAGMIAAAIAGSPDTDANEIQLDPNKLLQGTPDPAAPGPNDDDSLQFSINPERIGPQLHGLVSPTQTRARIYDRDGSLLLDSQTLSYRGPNASPEVREPQADTKSWTARLWTWLWTPPLPTTPGQAALWSLG